MVKTQGFVAVILNPHAGSGRARHQFEAVRSILQEGIDDFRVLTTHQPRHGVELARQCIRDGARVVIAAGGDGTNFEVLNGFFQYSLTSSSSQRMLLLNQSTAMASLPLGTGSDFHRQYPKQSIQEHARNLNQAILEERMTHIDVGVAYVTTEDRTMSPHMFLNVAGYGLPGVVDAEVNRSSKAWGAAWAYASGTLRAVLKYQTPTVHHRSFTQTDKPALMDNSESIVALAKGGQKTSCFAHAIANGRFFGGGMLIAPSAILDDGMLDVVRIEHVPLWQVPMKMPRLFQGSHLNLPECTEEKAVAHVAVPASHDEIVPIDLDGESYGHLPAAFEILPRALRFIR